MERREENHRRREKPAEVVDSGVKDVEEPASVPDAGHEIADQSKIVVVETLAEPSTPELREREQVESREQDPGDGGTCAESIQEADQHRATTGPRARTGAGGLGLHVMIHSTS